MLVLDAMILIDLPSTMSLGLANFPSERNPKSPPSFSINALSAWKKLENGFKILSRLSILAWQGSFLKIQRPSSTKFFRSLP